MGCLRPPALWVVAVGPIPSAVDPGKPSRPSPGPPAYGWGVSRERLSSDEAEHQLGEGVLRVTSFIEADPTALIGLRSKSHV